MGVSWTDEQQEVIRRRGSNLLVSAAAGSGKTAVLVERILSMVTDPEHPVDIDRLLIVTFTRAAAGEMRDRIGKALEEKLAEDPENEHLQRQGVLLGHAQISTIHGFCTYVIQNYFHRIGIDPGYRIAEEGELKLLKAAVLRDLLEEEYASGREEFLRFMDSYSPGRTDRRAEDLILRIFEFAVSDPDPEEWLRRCVRSCEAQNSEELTSALWMQGILEETRLRLVYAAHVAENCLRRCAEEGGPTNGIPVFEADLELLREISSHHTYDDLCQVLAKPKYARWGTPKKLPEGEDPAIREEIRETREKYKKILKDLRDTYYSSSGERILEELAAIHPHIEELVRLVLLFSEQYSENKRNRNIVDFNDLEHFALRILLEKQEDGSFVRTDAARELAAGFEEVMIDEYQDSNFIQEALLAAVSGNAEGRFDRFMVGDIKQSIYSFRMARPELFLEKYNSYRIWDRERSESEGTEIRVDLGKNFRSRREVLETCNAFFERLMIPELGGIRYDDAAALHTGADYPEGADRDFPKTEILLIDPEDEAWEGAGKDGLLQAEALAVAARIRKLHAEGRIWDKKTESFREVRYRDCVVLLRSAAGMADTFVKVLRDEGIPAYAASRAGYFSAVEVVTVLNYLRILDNPQQDIPFTAVLRSPIVGCTDEELAAVRISSPGTDMYHAVLQYQAMDDDAGKKLRQFLARLEDMRRRVPYTAIHELIRQVMDETGYGQYAAAMPAGAQRAANLRMLEEKAVDYENTSYHGLFNFVRYIEKLEKYEVDFGEVNLFGEGEDTVRVMTIHKSKGLEFPIVFVSGLGKGFNQMDQKAAVTMHAGLGIGMDVVDLRYRTKAPSLLKRAIAGAIRRDSCGEELRILYVAMTRAKEKLILTGICRERKLIDAARDRQTSLELRAGKLPPGQKLQPEPCEYGTLISAKTYLDWILEAVPEPRLAEIRVVRPEELACEVAGESLQTIDVLNWIRSRLFAGPETKGQAAGGPGLPGTMAGAVREFLRAKESFCYPYSAENALPAKLTVSEIKKASMEAMGEEKGAELYPEEEIVPYLPAFMRTDEKEQIRGAARGTAYHHVLECLDYRELAKEPHPSDESIHREVMRQLESMKERGLLSREEEACIRPADLVLFLQSEIGQRMAQASLQGKLRREQPFVIDIPAKDIDRNWPEDENILVQGTIDAFFEEDGQYILVDYKTDRVFSADGTDLVQKYRKQLEYYRLALERITEIPVREMYIYSVTLGKQIPVAG